MHPENKMWLKNKEGAKIELNSILAYVNDDVLYEGYLEKQSKKIKGMKKYYYRLYKDRLERYDDPVTEDPNSVLILRGVKCEMLNITNDEDFKDTDDKFLFIFTLNKNFIILYCKEEVQFQEWKVALK